jgi:hypothetical protein
MRYEDRSKPWYFTPKRIRKVLLEDVDLSPAEILVEAIQAYSTHAKNGKLKVRQRIFAGLLFPEFWGNDPAVWELRDALAQELGLRRHIAYLEYPAQHEIHESHPDTAEEATEGWLALRRLGGRPAFGDEEEEEEELTAEQLYLEGTLPLLAQDATMARDYAQLLHTQEKPVSDRVYNELIASATEFYRRRRSNVQRHAEALEAEELELEE